MPKQPCSTKELKEFYERRFTCGFFTFQSSIQKSAKVFELSAGTSQYWRDILLENQTTNHQHGGKR